MDRRAREEGWKEENWDENGSVCERPLCLRVCRLPWVAEVARGRSPPCWWVKLGQMTRDVELVHLCVCVWVWSHRECTANRLFWQVLSNGQTVRGKCRKCLRDSHSPPLTHNLEHFFVHFLNIWPVSLPKCSQIVLQTSEEENVKNALNALLPVMWWNWTESEYRFD